MAIGFPLPRKVLIFLALIGLGLPLCAESPRVIIETGPTGPVAFSILDRRTGFTFTGGEDGILRAWDTGTGNLVYSLRLSFHLLRMAAIHPKKSEIAVMTSDNLNSFVLTVWDWRTKENKGSYKLPDFPLFLKYSPTGSFLVYGITQWRSLTFLNTSSGAVLPYLTDGFGIVSNAFISGSGETILTYGPSGTLQYWNIQGGILKKRVVTLPDLSLINFTPGGRYMIAAKDEKILLVDLISGVPREELRLPSVQHMKLDPTGKTVIAYSEDTDGYRLSAYTISGSTLVRTLNYVNLGIGRIDTLLPLEDAILMTLPTGEIKRFSQTEGRLETFAASTLQPIEDLAAASETLLLGTSEELISLNAGFLSDEEPFDTGNLKPLRVNLPFSPPLGLSVYGENSFLLYTKEGTAGNLALFSPEEGVSVFPVNLPYAFTAIDTMGSKTAALDRRGDIRIIDMETGEVGFNFSSFGIQTLAFIDETTLVVGRRQNSTISTPLLQLNTVTGETVSIADTNLFSFQLGYHGATRKLYSLGIEKKNSKFQTVLKSHGGSGFEKVETLAAAPGENLEARMLVEPEDSRVYTSLEGRRINMLYGGGNTAFMENSNLPEKIVLLGDFLVVLNRDGSLGFWRKQAGKEVFTVYLFRDKTWIALYPGGQFHASPGGERHLSFYDGSSAAMLKKAPFRRLR